MRLRKHQRDAGPISGEVGVPQRRHREGRGLGPFTGRQLTTIICVGIVAVVAAPTAALAAGGAFTNNSATVPAVKATNANAHGIGVQGTGKKFGVYSNGPLGVAAGKALTCGGCVAPTDLSSAVKTADPIYAFYDDEGSSPTIYGHHLVQIFHSSTGEYQLQFDRDISRCALTATVNSPRLVASAEHGPLLHDPATYADVQIYESDNSIANDAPFSVVVTC